ncbi:MAG TPA: hypothetical protein VF326_07205, partial [Anaerolineaceae bacterium]
AAWQEGFTTLFERGPQPIVTSGIWTAEDTYVLTLRAYETPFYYTMICHFQDDTLTVTSEMNVSFEPAASPILTGHIS